MIKSEILATNRISFWTRSVKVVKRIQRAWWPFLTVLFLREKNTTNVGYDEVRILEIRKHFLDTSFKQDLLGRHQ